MCNSPRECFHNCRYGFRKTKIRFVITSLAGIVNDDHLNLFSVIYAPLIYTQNNMAQSIYIFKIPQKCKRGRAVYRIAYH